MKRKTPLATAFRGASGAGGRGVSYRRHGAQTQENTTIARMRTSDPLAARGTVKADAPSVAPTEYNLTSKSSGKCVWIEPPTHLQSINTLVRVDFTCPWYSLSQMLRRKSCNHKEYKGNSK